jgi:MinD-like ATPase involved in chromosome partitioning or flagellar assembly
MSTVGTASGADQAAGLRDIFGSELCRVICIASTLDPDSTIHLGHGTAHSIKQLGHKVLLVDEVPLADRKTMSGFLYPVRYDLGQVFSSSVDLVKTIKQVEDNLWYATSVRLRSEVASRFAKYPKLDERLVRHEIDIDYVVFPTIDPQANIVAYFGNNIKRILVASTEESCLKRAMVMIRQMAELQLDEPLAVLIIGGQDEEAGNAAFEKLKDAAQRALEQTIESLGWIKAVTAQRVEIDLDDMSFNPVTQGTPHEFVLPHGFFKAISAKITA